jgi:dTDP-4-dehydrorhamnose 3,5-epimerase
VDGIVLTPLKQIEHPQGNIFHAMKISDDGYSGFGEAYFSTIKKGDIKGWKRHTEMVLNLIVPIGEIKFVIYDESTKEFFNIQLSRNNYQRLTIGPNLWVAFEGVNDTNMLLNIANIEHNPSESISVELDSINYEW